MKTTPNEKDKYTVVINRVAKQMLEAYDRFIQQHPTHPNLAEHNRGFITACKTLLLIQRIWIALMLAVIIVPVPLAMAINWSGLLPTGLSSFTAACVFVSVVSIGTLLFLRTIWKKADFEFCVTESCLEQFKRMVESLGTQHSPKSAGLNGYIVHANLLLMVKDVLNAQEMIELSKKRRFNDVRDIVSVNDSLRAAEEKLAYALGNLQYFGLSHTRADLFREVEAKTAKK